MVFSRMSLGLASAALLAETQVNEKKITSADPEKSRETSLFIREGNLQGAIRVDRDIKGRVAHGWQSHSDEGAASLAKRSQMLLGFAAVPGAPFPVPLYLVRPPQFSG